MNNYEGLFIINPALGKEDLEKALSYIKDQIAKHKGTVERMEDLGKKRLSYSIKKQREGQYYLLHFKVEPKIITELEHVYKVNDAILRVLITRKEK